jgi:acetyl-CoA carboxylase carboxyl transferase beta subunit
VAIRLSARAFIDRVLDADSWQPWDLPLVEIAHTSPEYASELAAARTKSGMDESVIVGEGLLDGRRVAIAVQDFNFLGGSMGVAATERLVQGIERATRERLPLLAAPNSGGTRMQEGTVAFVQMIKIAAVVSQHRTAGLPFLVYLRNPTMGGVLASFGSLGHITVAEPGALVGFLGPRVYEALTGNPFPADVQTAENLYRHGIVDGVVGIGALRDIAARGLRVLDGVRDARATALPSAPAKAAVASTSTAWDSVLRTRRAERPGVRALLRYGATDVLPLSGSGEGDTDPELFLALARFGAAPCIVIGQDRRGHAVQPIGPAGLRAARRGMDLAAELGLPVVTVIDTAGAALSQSAEESALAGEIARSLAQLVTLATPTVSVILGMGTGGGALALLPADRVLCAEHGWLSPLPPEGASAILFRTTDRAAEMAEQQGVRSSELLANGIVDVVVAEPVDAADAAEAFCVAVAAQLEYELLTLLQQPDANRTHTRLDRYRRLGLATAISH